MLRRDEVGGSRCLMPCGTSDSFSKNATGALRSIPELRKRFGLATLNQAGAPLAQLDGSHASRESASMPQPVAVILPAREHMTVRTKIFMHARDQCLEWFIGIEPNRELRAALGSMHFLVYPCTFPGNCMSRRDRGDGRWLPRDHSFFRCPARNYWWLCAYLPVESQCGRACQSVFRKLGG